MAKFPYLPVPIRPRKEKVVGSKSLASLVSGQQVQRLLGFWVCWHALGGFDGMLESGLWSRSGLYDNLSSFKRLYGGTPDDLLPELAEALRADAVEWPSRFPVRGK